MSTRIGSGSVFLILCTGLLFNGCASFDINTLDFSKGKSELVSSLSDNITYDPYADKLYFNVSNISKAYHEYLLRVLEAPEARKGVAAYGDFPPSPQDFKGVQVDGVNYIQRAKYTGADTYNLDYVKKNYSTVYYNLNSMASVTWEEVSFFVRNGWIVLKTGPARTQAAFRNYQLPMRFVFDLALYDGLAGGYSPTGMRYIDFTFTQEAAETPKSSVAPEGGGTDLSLEEKLTKLKQLLDNGLITQEDYDKKKADLLRDF